MRAQRGLQGLDVREGERGLGVQVQGVRDGGAGGGAGGGEGDGDGARGEVESAAWGGGEGAEGVAGGADGGVAGEGEFGGCGEDAGAPGRGGGGVGVGGGGEVEEDGFGEVEFVREGLQSFGRGVLAVRDEDDGERVAFEARLGLDGRVRVSRGELCG